MKELQVHKKISDIVFTHVASEYMKEVSKIHPETSASSFPPETMAQFFLLGQTTVEAPQTFVYAADLSNPPSEARLALNSFHAEEQRVSQELERKDEALLE